MKDEEERPLPSSSSFLIHPSSFILRLAKFRRAFGGCLDGIHERATNAAALHFMKAGNGGAAGAGDGILERTGVLAGLEDHASSTEDGLGGQGSGNVSGQADTYPAVGEGLDHEIDERRSAAGEAGDGIEERLGQAKRSPNGVEEQLDE
jgi:hypothetical protein